MARKYQERHKALIDSLEAVMFPFQESEFEAESFTDIGRQRVDEWLAAALLRVQQETREEDAKIVEGFSHDIHYEQTDAAEIAAAIRSQSRQS